MGKRELRKKIKSICSSIFSILVYSYIYIPVIILIIFSFNDQRANTHWVGFTTEWYVKLFTNSELLAIYGNTLIIAVISTIFSVIIGTIGAVGLTRFRFKGRSVINNALYVPIVIPEIVLAVALLSIFSAINFPLGMLTLILGHTTLTLPFVIITIKSRLSGFDQSVEEASMDLGASRRTTFLKVTLPMIMPGVMSGGFLAFTLSLDDFIISNFIAGPKCMTFPVKVYSMVKSGVSPEVNALTTIVIALFLLGLLVSKLLEKKKA